MHVPLVTKYGIPRGAECDILVETCLQQDIFGLHLHDVLQTQLEIDKALQEDPNVYEYDDIYDKLQAEKVSTNVKEANRKDKKVRHHETVTLQTLYGDHAVHTQGYSPRK